MSWLIIAILSYFFWAVVSTTDKYLLGSKLIPSPKVYTFYMGILGILALGLIPFVGFSFFSVPQITLSLLSGAFFVLGSFFLYNALEKFEVSRVVPAIGGLLPVFTYGLIFSFSQGREILVFKDFIVFILLLAGSVLITIEKTKLVTRKSFQLAALAAFLFSLSFVLSKYVYSVQSFWPSFLWMRIGGFIMAVSFIFTEEVREELFRTKVSFQKKTALLFLSNQALGAGAFVLLNWAIFLAPLIYLTIINALAGTEYMFLLIFTIFLSFKFPQILKEEISRKILFQKIIAILLIGGGLALLTL